MTAGTLTDVPARTGTRRSWATLVPAAVLIALAMAGPLLAAHALDAPVYAPYAAAGDGGPLGGDQLGRDVLSRLLHGGTVLIGSAALVSVLVTLAGVVVGCFAVLHPVLGRAVERSADVAILLPPVLGIMLIALAWPGGGRWAVIGAAIVLGIPYAVRIVAAAAAPLAGAGYVEAALARGESLRYIALREILPNLRSTVAALFGLRFVEAVYVISMAAFLQIGPQPPAADWALMIRENAPGILLNPWAVIAPSLAIAALAISANLACASLAPRSARKAVTTP
ncbi:ABC transporter permease [Streptomyces nojiriensis]|uniref:ABC transporter permease n=1 Tax=Streptomyces nojiriensis TaxID=66374 RepID=A0ABQ3SN49_9ACTN|nr:ABC transporter permease subunit [Streptomyces nojiriensis]QTI43122.1 Glutathione transport system permease protein GsiD [Streptomyces nojiriensis]GGS31853.1 ABC transporter permease [Streptomyces nojiriensis]GHI69558.1 ABC transporter permease [Streptomyces nojiriensis]